MPGRSRQGRGVDDNDVKENDPSDSSSKRRRSERRWMDGRSVYFFPESRPSVVAKRDVVSSEAEHDSMTEAHVRSTLARRAMTPEQVEDEIAELGDYTPGKVD